MIFGLHYGLRYSCAMNLHGTAWILASAGDEYFFYICHLVKDNTLKKET